MKTQYRNMLWLAALSLAFAMGACQNEEIVESGQSANVEGQTILRATMGGYDTPQSRAQVELGNEDESQEVFIWNRDDRFTLYDRENPIVSSLFTISNYDDMSPSTEATFISEDGIVEGTNVTAIYPAQESNAVSGDVVTLTFPQAALTDGSDESWKSYMSQNMFMYAQATMAGANTALTFNQLCAMVRISYTNATDTDQNISKVTLTGDGNYFGNSMNFNLKTYEGNVTPTTSASLEFTNLTVASGRTVDFYLLFFPGDDASNGKLTISINESQAEMSLAEMTTKAFEAGKRYWLNVMQTKVDGLIWKKNVAEGVISNLNLIKTLEEDNQVQFVKDENGFVNINDNQEVISNITSLFLSQRENIDNIEGIEYLTGLQELYLSHLALQDLDVSKNVNLKRLECSENKLSKLDVSKNTALINLNCSSNQLEELNLGNIQDLEILECGHNRLTQLDVTHQTKLQTLNLSAGSWGSDVPCNLVSSLDISQNTELISLNVSNCPNLETLDITQNSKLKSLDYQGTRLIVDFSNNIELEELICSDYVTELDVSILPNLTRLISYADIASLDVSKNSKLENLICYSNNIKELDLSNNPGLLFLRCGGGSLQSLDISKNNALKDLDISYSSISSLDISGKTDLEFLMCYGCQLSTLDITNNPSLTYIRCGNQYDAEGNEAEITLLLTSSQQAMWEEQQWEWNNERVNAVVQE